jgi:hypothetical protein
MQVDLDRDGLAYLALQPGEQVVVTIGGAGVILVGTPGEEPFVQIVLHAPTAYVELKHSAPRAGRESCAVHVVENGERCTRNG